MNGVLVNGKSVGDVQKMLDNGRNCLLEVMRCRRMMPTSSDLSQSSPFPTPSSPLTADEFDRLSDTNVRKKKKNPAGLLHTRADGDHCKSATLPADYPNTSQLHTSSKDSFRPLGRSKESKPNFLNKAVSVITRPFLRSRQSRAAHGPNSKSAANYIGHSTMTLDDFRISDMGQNVSTTARSHHRDSAASKEQSPLQKKPSDDERGTWPKYHAHTAQRPSVLQLYNVTPSSSANDHESALLPRPPHHGINVRRSESARHHRPQISDTVVDCTSPPVDRSCSGQKSSSSTEDLPKSSVSCGISDSVTPLGPHCARRFPDQTNEISVTLCSHTPAEHHVTVISHFQVEHSNSEAGYHGGHVNYNQMPIAHTSTVSSPGQNSAEKQLQHLPYALCSLPRNRSQQLNLARYISFYQLL